MMVHYINNPSLQNFPHMKVSLRNEEIYSIWHGAALTSISSEEVYGKLISHDLVTFKTEHKSFIVLVK